MKSNPSFWGTYKATYRYPPNVYNVEKDELKYTCWYEKHDLTFVYIQWYDLIQFENFCEIKIQQFQEE